MKRLCIPLLLLLLVLPGGCRRKAVGNPAPPFPYEQMREGDLAFRCGQGFFSRAVMSAEDEPLYSHVGVLVKENGEWKVVHAVPAEAEFSGDFDRVKAEGIGTFFAPDRAFRGSLVHTGLADSARVSALREEALQPARGGRFVGRTPALHKRFWNPGRLPAAGTPVRLFKERRIL